MVVSLVSVFQSPPKTRDLRSEHVAETSRHVFYSLLATDAWRRCHAKLHKSALSRRRCTPMWKCLIYRDVMGRFLPAPTLPWVGLAGNRDHHYQAQDLVGMHAAHRINSEQRQSKHSNADVFSSKLSMKTLEITHAVSMHDVATGSSVKSCYL